MALNQPLRTTALGAVLVWALCSMLISCRHNVAAAAPANTGSPLLILPAGSSLALRTAETINSENAEPNRAYAAVITRDAKGEDPQNVLPSGSPVTLVLVRKATVPGAKQSWQLGIASATINGDAFLVRDGNAPADDQAAASLGAYLGGVQGPFYPSVSTPAPNRIEALIVSGDAIQARSGSLLTFRLQQQIVLVGSKRER